VLLNHDVENKNKTRIGVVALVDTTEQERWRQRKESTKRGLLMETSVTRTHKEDEKDQEKNIW